MTDIQFLLDHISQLETRETKKNLVSTLHILKLHARACRKHLYFYKAAEAMHTAVEETAALAIDERDRI